VTADGARDLLEDAIARAHLQDPDPLACRFCGCDLVVAEYRAGLGGWIPVSCHYASWSAEASCPVLSGGVETWMACEELWAALEAHLLVADYLELADVLAARAVT